MWPSKSIPESSANCYLRHLQSQLGDIALEDHLSRFLLWSAFPHKRQGFRSANSSISLFIIESFELSLQKARTSKRLLPFALRHLQT